MMGLLKSGNTQCVLFLFFLSTLIVFKHVVHGKVRRKNVRRSEPMICYFFLAVEV